MVIIDKNLQNFINPLKFDSMVNYFDVGSFVSLMGSKEQGIEILNRGIEESEIYLKGKDISKARENFEPIINCHGEDLAAYKIDLDMRSSRCAISYFKENNSLIHLSLDNIVGLLKSDLFFPRGLSYMGREIFTHLAMAEELKDREFTCTLHPNFLAYIAHYKVNDLSHISADTEEFYVKNPLPENLIMNAKTLLDTYYNKENIGTEKWIQFELDWSNTSIEVYKHFLEGYVKPLIEIKQIAKK
ncbi:MAG: hypothetical protein ACP5N2_03855 [Candidatus Nanoarchaeia archaeon]